MNHETTRSQGEQLLWVEPSRCIGCFGCEVACKLEHDLPAGPRPIMVIQIGPVEREGGLTLTFQVAACLHCDAPACVEACPTGAMHKRADGLVLSNGEICIGCQRCAIACPFGIPQLNPGNGKIAKCDGCADRVERGLSPVCVLACPTEALSFLTPLKRAQGIRERFSDRIRHSGLGR